MSVADSKFSFRNSDSWLFRGGQWHDGDSGMLLPPAISVGSSNEPWLDVHQAYYINTVYETLEAEFDFRRNSGHCGIGLIVRAQDEQHYYLVQFPFCGQQIREGHFWAAITRFDESGWGEVLVCERVPGIPCEAGFWNHARVVASDGQISLWVNGRPLTSSCDYNYPSAGCIGLAEWGGCQVKNLTIRGRETQSMNSAFSKNVFHPWFDLQLTNNENTTISYASPEPTAHQVISGLTKAADNSLWMTANNSLHRSDDNGRTWNVIPFFQELSHATIVKSSDGSLILLRVSMTKPFLIETARSVDDGHSWSEFLPAGEINVSKNVKEMYMYGSILTLKDGGLLYFGMTYPPNYELTVIDGRRYRFAQTIDELNFCIRSDDGGRTWSDPIDIDGPNPTPAHWMSRKDGCSEVSAIETSQGDIVAFTRPGSAWAMWESRSADGGRTWTPKSAGPFLSYACAAPARATASGALIVGGRFPALAIHVSLDNGMTWKTYQIDTEAWAMGYMYEVEPDVVLWIYGSGARQLRSQYIRITSDGAKLDTDFLQTER